MSSRGRWLLGAMFTVAGVLAWGVLLWAFEPAAYGIVRSQPDMYPIFDYAVDSAYIAQVLSAKSVRWGALILGVGGLVVMRQRIWPALGFGLVWLGADLALDLSDVDNLATAAVATVVVGAVAVALFRRPAAGPASGVAWPLLYSGIAIGFAWASTSVSVLWHGWAVLHTMTAPANVLLLLRVVMVLVNVLLVWSALEAAMAAHPRPSKRRLVAVVVGAVAALAGLASMLLTGGPAFNGLGDTTSLLLGFVPLSIPLLLVVAIVPAGWLPPGFRGATRYAGLVLAALAVTLPIAFARRLPWSLGPQGSVTVVRPPDTDADRYMTFPFEAILGLTLGLLAFTAHRLLAFGRRSQVVDPALSPVDTAPTGPRDRSWASVVGVALTVAGVVAWAVTATVVESTVQAFYDAHHIFSVDAMAAFVALDSDLQWAAIVLGVGGLILLARARGRRGAAVAGVVGWLLADVLLDRLNLGGWPMAAAAALAVGLPFLVLVRPRRGAVPVDGASPDTAESPWPLLYTGAAIGVAFLIFFNVERWMVDEVPLWTVLLVPTIGVLLLIAAVVNAFAAAPTTGPARVVAGVLVVLTGGAAILTHVWLRMSGADNHLLDFLMQRWLVPLAAAALILASVTVLGGLRRISLTLTAVSGVSVLLVLVASELMIGGVVTGVLAQWALTPLTGDRRIDDAYPMALTGVLFGLVVGLLALLPRAMATPPDGAPWEGAPLSPEPEPASAARREARPGVPEILEHPPVTPDPLPA